MQWIRLERRIPMYYYAEHEVFDSWVKSHLANNGLLIKTLLNYNDLSYVLGKDWATGARSKTFADGLDMSADELIAIGPGRSCEGRNALSESKRKCNVHLPEMVDIIHN
ncbi:retrotransposon protein [Cucumis melo var. makuwa]|uniref:Retrotransposon protein n=1 Tax=Cucumis melo var. makuwa TaxID=1194695 RepID=A0A5D3C7F7_CUCMM|nr:retrotransposon protein [Cucumis melo var. makuwa]TYK07821.1 retrotransposon protein [Cucumis melo var. makuwa]